MHGLPSKRRRGGGGGGSRLAPRSLAVVEPPMTSEGLRTHLGRGTPAGFRATIFELAVTSGCCTVWSLRRSPPFRSLHGMPS